MEETERLAAIEDIKRLKAKYFRCVDTKDWEGYRSVFADDLVFDITADMPDVGVIVGAEAAVAIPRGSLTSDVVSIHHGHCPEIEILSPTMAKGIWAMEDRLFWGPGSDSPGQSMHGMGHYTETYEKTEQGWRIKSLKLTRLRVEFNPASPVSA
ncbi:nuclear transport factor 2 family protein [Novosphingobium taihuense]|uniref:Ketosteroid isomerase-like protein n=1 Tax=Novosphingobium taihuense TaxID=260085 RepID=A0A7W7EUT2_9SPHN|nr:nuclear transport factor 2 family protein [Novosphingobium taihuense]MBB4614281.1 ketosteroid isomerase-like protein [Novosphingobium taihuense]TWH87128.1 SnoaL-like protein [Novosphingobium taihuense]